MSNALLYIMITKDTVICCSFSSYPGNFGCNFFNKAFQAQKLNFIYKAFAVNNIEKALDAMRTLNFRGAGVSMPFKKECLKYVDAVNHNAAEIGAANTIVNDDGKLTAYNTDWIAATHMIENHNPKCVFILGNGGYAQAVKYACIKKNLDYQIIERNNWVQVNYLRNEFIYNCTPLEKLKFHDSCTFIDCIIGTTTGDWLAKVQAQFQFSLYTGHFYKEEEE